ncbi:hypothetical protein V2J09_004040 [Rumex salicifolius]
MEYPFVLYIYLSLSLSPIVVEKERFSGPLLTTIVGVEAAPSLIYIAPLVSRFLPPLIQASFSENFRVTVFGDSMAGILQRPIMAVAAVAAASISTDLPNKLQSSISSDSSVVTEAQCHPQSEPSLVSYISVSKLSDLSFVNRIQVPVHKANNHPKIPSVYSRPISNSPLSSVISSPVLLELYQSAELAKTAKPMAYSSSVSASPSEDLYRWHLPDPNAVDVAGKSSCYSAKSKTVVVLLGWLGAKQKHLNRYAEFYTSRGFHAVTFTFPMSDVLSYQVGGKAEREIESLAEHLTDWLDEEQGKNLVFHTFSNTGWLTYGVILDNIQKQDPSLTVRIKGCIVDSAPVAAPDPQVWASGFSAAFLKKQSVATRGSPNLQEHTKQTATYTVLEHKPAATETALLVVLEKLFNVVLNFPSVNRRLSDVMGILSSNQPKCPQLYIYSSADRVIPAKSVESFMDEQRRSGHEVRACNFVSSPHVDHFRNNPQLYKSQLTQFLDNCVFSDCKGPS